LFPCNSTAEKGLENMNEVSSSGSSLLLQSQV
jgi:hypothetical protein